MEKKFKVVTLGCRTNQYESQAYTDQLRQMGYTSTDAADAEICVVNTCTVTEGAENSSRKEILALRRAHPHAKIVVTGCMVESSKDHLLSLDSSLVIVPNQEKEKLVQHIFPDESQLPEFSIHHFEAHTRAFVKVQDGCNSFCTYCIIPYVRGRSRSRTIAEVVKEVEQLIANGYREVVLTGINIGDFADGEMRLADLVRAVDKIEGLDRLRLSSIDPDEVDEALGQAILGGRVTCPSMHVVLQSGSNVVLKRMNRKYTRQIFLDTVEKLKKANPDFTFTTDVIVGFPGESLEDFQDTLDVMRSVEFAKVHMFPYSRRKRTRADLYKDHLPSDEIGRRKQIVLKEAEKTGYQLRSRFVGRSLPVLFENRENEEWMVGHTHNFLPVRVRSKEEMKNQIANVYLVENSPLGLIGEIV